MPTGFERSRRLVLVGLIVAAGLIVTFWVLWWSDRSLVASRTTSEYNRFEGGFALADAWLLIAVTAAAMAVWRQRASGLLWLIAAGSSGVYLLGMDLLYDLRHSIYAGDTGGTIEVLIDVLVAGASVGVLRWSWRNRETLTSGRAAGLH